MQPLRFTGRVIKGLGFGTSQTRYPTINLDLSDVPETLEHGIYAGAVILGDARMTAAIHYGPRPVFDASESFEIHVLDAVDNVPREVQVELVRRLRDVEDFPSVESLKAAIAEDIRRTREIVG
jgi:riboflavin kinase / FMN adenylyltransferase